MRLGKKQIETLKRFGETPHPSKQSYIRWKWGDWHLARKARTMDGVWPAMRSLVKRGLIETRPYEGTGPFKDCFECRTTEEGRKTLERRNWGENP